MRLTLLQVITVRKKKRPGLPAKPNQKSSSLNLSTYRRTMRGSLLRRNQLVTS